MANGRVLVIDEDLDARRSMRDALRDSDWQVDEAEDGLSALEQIREARAYGGGYTAIVSEFFLRDFDGVLFFSTLRRQYPELPIVVQTAYGDGSTRKKVEALAPGAYFDKPVDAAAWLQLLDSYRGGTTTLYPLPPGPAPEPEYAVSAYVFVKFDTLDHAGRYYAELKALKGVISANALKGEGVDLVMRVGMDTPVALEELLKAAGQISGVTVVRSERLADPPLSRDSAEFTAHFHQVAFEGRANYVQGHETNAYLMIDIDRFQLERIYLSILLTEGVIRCRVLAGLNKLMVLVSGTVRPNVIRHLLQKLAQMDGIRRVKEVRVVNISA